MFIATIVSAVISTSGLNSLTESKWKYEIPITIEQEQIPGTSDWVGFPMYINLSSFGAHFWTYVKDGGSDIRVFDANGTTELPRHVLSFVDNGTSGTGTLFTKVTLDADTDKTIFLRYGNPNANEPGVNDANGQYSVWTSLAQGWSMTEASGTLSSLNGGFTMDVLSDVTLVSGKLEKTTTFNDTTSCAGIANNGTVTDLPTNGTFTCWTYFDNFYSGSCNNERCIWLGTETGTGNNRWDLRLNNTGNVLLGSIQTTSSNGIQSSGQQLSSSDNGLWRHWAWVKSGTSWTIYKNASTVSMSDATSHNTSGNTLNEIQIGKECYDIKIDMVCWFSSSLSANQVTTLFNNQNAPNSFKTVGEPRSLWKSQVVN